MNRSTGNLDRLAPGLVHHIVNTLGWSSLRPLQREAILPLADGYDALLLAPTAGGKTEAAVFPVLTAMIEGGWRGLSVLYVCPLRALLNNLYPRIDAYASWIGRTAGLWHGDTGQGQRRRMRVERPDILLTTPESVESLLVSPLVDPREFFADLRVVIVDEVHAFAGDDRGWHLLAVLERVSRLAGRPLQRVGLSATVGNPEELMGWLQGSAGRSRSRAVICTDVQSAPGALAIPEVGLDHVGSIQNAGLVISSLHRGEKRLVFCESRARVEALAMELRGRDVNVFVSHSSLSADERRRAEEAFAEARDCVIVSTSTLELGIDVGDLDRVIQIDAPRTVASFLQRLGRTGRRPGASRNTLFVATTRQDLLHAAGLLRLWRDGFVEPITPPPAPRHIAAQQILALCLQEGRVGDATWPQWWGELPIFDQSAPEIVRWLVETDHLSQDHAGMLYIGPEAERRYGRRNFMDLLTVFAAPLEFTVVHGRRELGGADAMMLMRKVSGPRLLALGGRAWRVNHIDWHRHRCYVEPADRPARSLWQGVPQPHSYELCQAQRNVLLGAEPEVEMSKRAAAGLAKLRDEEGHRAAAIATVVEVGEEGARWWTWAGARGNATLAAALPRMIDEDGRVDNHSLRLRSDVTMTQMRAAIDAVVGSGEIAAPEATEEAVQELKFGEVLPPDLAISTLSRRLADEAAAHSVLGTRVRLSRSTGKA